MMESDDEIRILQLLRQKGVEVVVTMKSSSRQSVVCSSSVVLG